MKLEYKLGNIFLSLIKYMSCSTHLFPTFSQQNIISGPKMQNNKGSLLLFFITFPTMAISIVVILS